MNIYSIDILNELLSTDENPQDPTIRLVNGQYETDSINKDDIKMVEMLNNSLS